VHASRSSRWRAYALVLVVALLALTACSDDDDDDSAATSSSSSSTSSTSAPDGSASTTTTGPRESPIATPSEAPKSAAPTGGTALLTDVRVARHNGFDRIVLEFQGDPPGYTVEYTNPPITEDASGEEVELEGSAFLRIRMEPASGVEISGEQPRQTYTGPSRFKPADAAVVEEVVRTGDFEAVLSWVAGLDRRVPFALAALRQPGRLVIDVMDQ
jgi:hypothetical protein